MKFLEIAKILENEEKNKNTIVLIRCGAFFTAIDKDASFIAEILELKKICMIDGICKIGIPVNSIYEYIEKLQKLNYNFVIYNYSKEKLLKNNKKYEEIYRYEGNPFIKENIMCICGNCIRRKEHKGFDNINLFEELKKLQKKKEENK